MAVVFPSLFSSWIVLLKSWYCFILLLRVLKHVLFSVQSIIEPIVKLSNGIWIFVHFLLHGPICCKWCWPLQRDQLLISSCLKTMFLLLLSFCPCNEFRFIFLNSFFPLKWYFQVFDVKRNIEALQGSDVYPAEQQMLIHQGKVLKDPTTLEENKVAENSFVVIMLTKVNMFFTYGVYLCELRKERKVKERHMETYDSSCWKTSCTKFVVISYFTGNWC